MTTSSPPSYTVSPSIPASWLVSPTAFLAANPHLVQVIASAIIFHPTQPKTLVVRRSPTDGYPLKWEYPGGSSDPTDADLVAVAVRELFEETGLAARRVLCSVGAGLASTVDDSQFDKDTGLCTFLDDASGTWGKASFVVEVESCEKVVLDPEEHVEWAWVTEDEVRKGVFADQEGRELDLVSQNVTDSLLDAFRLRRENKEWREGA